MIGQVVSTVKDSRHEGFKLLLVQPVDCDSNPKGASLLTIDAAQAGVGDYVLVLAEGKSARQIMKSTDAPCEAIIIGVVDHICVHGRTRVMGADTLEEGAHGG